MNANPSLVDSCHSSPGMWWKRVVGILVCFILFQGTIHVNTGTQLSQYRHKIIRRLVWLYESVVLSHTFWIQDPDRVFHNVKPCSVWSRVSGSINCFFKLDNITANLWGRFDCPSSRHHFTTTTCLENLHVVRSALFIMTIDGHRFDSFTRPIQLSNDIGNVWLYLRLYLLYYFSIRFSERNTS